MRPPPMLPDDPGSAHHQKIHDHAERANHRDGEPRRVLTNRDLLASGRLEPPALAPEVFGIELVESQWISL